MGWDWFYIGNRLRETQPNQKSPQSPHCDIAGPIKHYHVAAIKVNFSAKIIWTKTPNYLCNKQQSTLATVPSLIIFPHYSLCFHIVIGCQVCTSTIAFLLIGWWWWWWWWWRWAINSFGTHGTVNRPRRRLNTRTTENTKKTITEAHCRAVVHATLGYNLWEDRSSLIAIHIKNMIQDNMTMPCRPFAARNINTSRPSSPSAAWKNRPILRRRSAITLTGSFTDCRAG